MSEGGLSPLCQKIRVRSVDNIVESDDLVMELGADPANEPVAKRSHARWLLIEAAPHYRLVPEGSKERSVRQQGLSQEIKACSWKAQTRLRKRLLQ